MASKIYTSDGVVLARMGVGEASLLVSLFTKEFGRILARAQGARSSSSKLRFALEPLSHGTFSLVKGRAGWRLVGAQAKESLIFPGARGIRALGNIAALLSRLAPPQEPAPVFYSLLMEDARFLGSPHDEETLRSAECIAVLHILSAFGYLPSAPDIAVFAGQETNIPLAEAMKPLRVRAVSLINASLSATGL